MVWGLQNFITYWLRIETKVLFLCWSCFLAELTCPMNVLMLYVATFCISLCTYASKLYIPSTIRNILMHLHMEFALCALNSACGHVSCMLACQLGHQNWQPCYYAQNYTNLLEIQPHGLTLSLFWSKKVHFDAKMFIFSLLCLLGF